MWRMLHGNNVEVMRSSPDLGEECVDAIVTDPPSGTGFMGKDWDCFRRRHNPEDVGRDNVMGRMSAHAPHSYGESDRGNFIADMTLVMRESLRVLKPGGYALVWALPRTSHWTATAVENAGFEVRDVITHHFGSGFPKSQDVGKFIDKLAGAEREVVGVSQSKGIRPGSHHIVGDTWEQKGHDLTAPATAESKAWDGWGTALKPASEHWILARKPLSESSIARNVLQHGVGALNIDACRVDRAADDVPGWHTSGANGSAGYRAERCPDCGGGVECQSCGGTGFQKGTFVIREMSAEEIQERCGGKGRWPTNLLLTHAADCDEDCCEDCPVAELDRQSGTLKSGKMRAGTLRANRTGYAGDMPEATGQETHGDSGGASRFFPNFRYFAKPSRAEREAGLDSLPDRTLNRVNSGGLENEPRFAPIQVKNNHPTVKGKKLMAWLIQLITPPGGVVFDPFAGSGSTGVAAVENGYSFIGIEQDADSFEIAEARIRHAAGEAGLFA